MNAAEPVAQSDRMSRDVTADELRPWAIALVIAAFIVMEIALALALFARPLIDDITRMYIGRTLGVAGGAARHSALAHAPASPARRVLVRACPSWTRFSPR